MCLCKSLHSITRQSKIFNYYDIMGSKKIPQNGIALLFENGESGHAGKRIVGVTINREIDRLPKRLKNHYEGSIRNSIMRKHMGKCLKNKNLEQNISDYIQKNISMAIINCENKKERSELKKRIIATVKNCTQCKSSENWLGHQSMNEDIRDNGLWLVQDLNGTIYLSNEDLEYINNNIV